MPLSYPIAATARAALDTEDGARTIGEAREKAGMAVTLVSEWLRPQPAERDEVQGRAEAGASRGFVQLYEDVKGRPVIAVTFWKPTAQGAQAESGKADKAKADGTKAKSAKASRAKAAKEKPVEAPPAPVDTVDDLYFEKSGATRRAARRRRSERDTRQLDLFGGADAPDAEHADAPNRDTEIDRG